MKNLKKHFTKLLFALLLVGLTTSVYAQDRGEAVQAFNKALELAKQNKYEQSIEMYNQAISISQQLGEEGQDIVKRAENQLPSIYYQMALQDYKQFQKNKSLSTLEQTIESFSRASDMSSDYGNQQISQKADQIVTQLLYNKSILQFKNSNYDASLATLDQAIQRDPNYAKAYYQKGIVLKNQDSSGLEKAIAMFEKAIEVGQKTNDRQIVRQAREAAHDELVYRGVQQIENKNYDQAINLLNRALNYTEQSADAHYRLAEAYNKKTQFDQALEHARQALQFENGGKTEKAKIYFEIGIAQKNKGNKQAACSAYTNAAFGSFKSSSEHAMEYELKCDNTTN